MSINEVSIDPRRLQSQEAEDAELMREFEKAGDVPDVVRPINAFFVVPAGEIERVKIDVVAIGWKVVSAGDPEDGTVYLNLERSQAITPNELARLRADALKIAAYYHAEYDGWEAPVETKRN